MQRILYVSENRIEEPDTERVVAQIIDHARLNNARLGLTGALLFTGLNFAQILEGPAQVVDGLMARIAIDPRHQDVVVIEKSAIAHRLFTEWEMAYQGPSQFVSRHVEKLLQTTSSSGRQRAAEWVTDFALEFTKTRTP